VIASLQKQTLPLDEILIIDDGSIDNSAKLARDLRCRVIRFEENLGRGHSRNVGISECKTDFALFCDSTNILPPNFSALAIKHFNRTEISAVFGRIVNHPELNDVFSRWRGRHLFREHLEHRNDVHEVRCLISYAVLARKEAVLSSGNFDRSLRKCEDQDMGEKLIGSGYKILSDPSLLAYSVRKESMTSLAIRFNRWFSFHQQDFRCLEAFLKTLRSSIMIFLRSDFRKKDFHSMMISILLPFWLLALAVFRKERLTD